MKRILFTFSLSLSLCQVVTTTAYAQEHVVTDATSAARSLILPRNAAIGAQQRAQAALPIEAAAKRIAEIRTLLPAAPLRGARYDLPMVGERVEIELFPGERLVAEGREVRDGLDGVRTWIADIEGGGLITLTRDRKGGVYGTVERLPHVYNLLRGRDGKLYAVDIDQRALPPENDGDLGDASLKLAPLPLATTKSGGSAAIDLVVVYTPRVATRYTPSLLAQNGVANLNAAMQYAGIDVTVNLVAVEQVDYVDPTTFNAAHADLVAGRDGLEQAHELRGADYGYGADLVLLLVAGDRTADTCGLASYPILGRTPSQLRNEAWAVVGDHCVNSSHSLPHEIGHLLSARHARTDAHNILTTQARHPYSYGFISKPPGAPTADHFRTIMAIGENCAIPDCPRLLRWSDSAHTYNSYPLGFPEGHINPVTGQPDAADNARAIADYAPTVALYNTPIPLAPPIAPQPFSVNYICGGINRASWGDSPGVEYFELYKKAYNASFWTRIYSGLQHSFDLTVTVNTDMRVRACNAAGCSGFLGGMWAMPPGHACP